MKIIERYSTAVHSSNLKSKEGTTYSDSDVIGAFGLAGKTHPLATSLHRLLAGDDCAAVTVVTILAGMARRNNTSAGGDMTEVQSFDMARATLAWYRHGTCQTCHGHGYQIMPGTPSLSDVECPACKGTGKLPFDAQFHAKVRNTAVWLLSEIERELAKAGPAAMRALAPSLTL